MKKKHLYQIRFDYKDLYGNDIRITKNYNNKCVIDVVYLWHQLFKKDMALTYLIDGKTIKKFIAYIPN